MSSEDFKPFPHFSTNALHVGQDPSQWASRAVVPPISLSTTFKQDEPGVHAGFEYSRSGNPTRNVTEECIASLENGKHCLLFASGLGATTTITHMFGAGDHILAMDDIYGGSNRYFRKVAGRFNVETTFVDMTDLKKVKSSLTPKTKMVWIETPTNPMMKLVDIEAVVKIVRAYPGVIIVVDNTFMSPYFQRPLDLGADISFHSISKYINGHSDVIMGAVITNSDEIAENLRFLQNAAGAIPSPFDCYLTNRGVKTLAVRMQAHMKNGLRVAEYLEANPRIERVFHPGLKSHPQHELAKRQMRGYSGMVTVLLKGGEKEARIFLKTLKVFALAESLGGFESLAEHLGIMTHASVEREERLALGITDNLVRLSVGIEDIEDIIEDLEQALKAAIP